MSNSWDDMRKAKEESYFDKKNKEAIQRLAKKKEAEKPRLSPITGKEMEQVVIGAVVVDKCSESGGIWLDAGELEQLIEASEQDSNSILSTFKEMIGIKK